MRAKTLLPLIALIGLACSLPATIAGGADPTATQGVAIVPTATPSPPTQTAPPPTPTPASRRITSETVADLVVVAAIGEGTVRSVAFSPDGSVLAAAEGDPAATIGTITLYDSTSGRAVRLLEGHELGVRDLAFSPDGRYLASAGRDHTARIWDWRNGTLVRSLDFENEMNSVAFSPDSGTLAVGGVDEPEGGFQDAAIWTYAVDTWEPRLKLAEFWNIGAIAFTPDGSHISGGGTSRNVRVWRAGDGAEAFVLYHAGQVGGLAVSPDGSTLAAGLCEASVNPGSCSRGAVWLWDLANGRHSQSLSSFPEEVKAVAYSPDGSTLIAASGDGTIQAFSTVDGRVLLTTTGPAGSIPHSVSDLALSPDGRVVATGRSNGIEVWRIRE